MLKKNKSIGKINSIYLAIFLMMMGILFVDFYGVIIKSLGNTYPMAQLTMFRNSFAVLPIFILIYFSGEGFKIFQNLDNRFLFLCFLRGISFLIMQLAYFIAIINMDFATATTLSFSSPIFIVILSLIFLRDKIGFYRWFAVGIGFMGVIIIMKPASSIFSLYALLPLLVGLSWAFANILIKFYPEKTSTAKINFYTLIFSFLGSLIVLSVSSDYTSIQSLNHWTLMVAIGCLGGCASIFFIFAYRLVLPSVLGPFEYLGIPSSFFLGWFFFSESPIDDLFPGVIFIIFAGLIIIWREKTLALKVEKNKKLHQA